MLYCVTWAREEQTGNSETDPSKHPFPSHHPSTAKAFLYAFRSCLELDYMNKLIG